MKKIKIDRKSKKPIYRFISGSRLFESKKNAKKYEQSVELESCSYCGLVFNPLITDGTCPDCETPN